MSAKKIVSVCKKKLFHNIHLPFFDFQEHTYDFQNVHQHINQMLIFKLFHSFTRNFQT